MARIALILLLSFIFLCFNSQAREAPRLAGESRVGSLAIEDSELSRQIALSLRNPLNRRFHRSHRMPTSSAIRLAGGCHHGRGSLRMYPLGPMIPVENFRQIVRDSGFGMHSSFDARRMKIKRWEKRGGDGLLSPIWGFLRSAFQDFYGWFTGFVRGDYY